MKILVVDVGGNNVKVLVSGRRVPVKIASGPSLTAKEMVHMVKAAVADWHYDVVSIGFPGPVKHGKPVHEPVNLGTGWVGFNFSRAFGRPVKMVNDAAMQALGSYRGGRMLFLGLGTGLGTALIIHGTMVPMELGHLPYRRNRTYEQYLGSAALKRRGKRRWRRDVLDVIARFRAAFQTDEVVVGGGNVKAMKGCPKGVRIGSNRHAFAGGYRLWK